MVEMNSNKVLIVFVGIGIILYSLVSYLWFKSLLGIFNCSLCVMILIFVLYNEDKKIGYLMALFGVNVFQWLFLIYVFFNNLIYIKTDFYYILIGAPFFTLVLVNQVRKNHLKSPENAKINMLKDKKRLMLLSMGVVITIGCLVSFIVYYAPIFLYGATLGLMSFIYGFYSENRKVNVSTNYAKAMALVLIAQWITIICFWYQFAEMGLVVALVLSGNITMFFSIQIYVSDLRISNQKKENIIGIFAVVLFIAMFGALILKGYL
jgi:hypothetical protein